MKYEQLTKQTFASANGRASASKRAADKINNKISSISFWTANNKTKTAKRFHFICSFFGLFSLWLFCVHNTLDIFFPTVSHKNRRHCRRNRFRLCLFYIYSEFSELKSPLRLFGTRTEAFWHLVHDLFIFLCSTVNANKNTNHTPCA